MRDKTPSPCFPHQHPQSTPHQGMVAVQLSRDPWVIPSSLTHLQLSLLPATVSRAGHPRTAPINTSPEHKAQQGKREKGSVGVPQGAEPVFPPYCSQSPGQLKKKKKQNTTPTHSPNHELQRLPEGFSNCLPPTKSMGMRGTSGRDSSLSKPWELLAVGAMSKCIAFQLSIIIY